jgi:hypothetical protein
MFIQTEATPNPATLKFLPGRSVLGEATREFKSTSESEASPLARRLFEIPGVTGVFLGGDFVTVTKAGGEWQHLKPAVLGAMIGSALVGTFLGVFLAYGIVGPMASRLVQVLDEEHQFYKIIMDVLVAHLHGNAAQVSVEIGRGSVPSPLAPSFAKLEEALNNMPNDA